MELALGWMRDEITTTQAQRMLKCSSVNQTVYRMAIAIRQARREGLLLNEAPCRNIIS